MIVHNDIDSYDEQLQNQAMRYGMTNAVTPETYAWSPPSWLTLSSDYAQSLFHTRTLYDLVQPHGLSDLSYQGEGNRALFSTIKIPKEPTLATKEIRQSLVTQGVLDQVPRA